MDRLFVGNPFCLAKPEITETILISSKRVLFDMMVLSSIGILIYALS